MWNMQLYLNMPLDPKGAVEPAGTGAWKGNGIDEDKQVEAQFWQDRGTAGEI